MDAPGGITLDEGLSGLVWAVLTVGALRAALRSPADRRSTWIVVTLFCGVFVTDKLFDVQTAFYALARWVAHAAVPAEVREGSQDALRYALLLPLTGLALAGVIWLVRRDRHIDLPKRLALAGVCGIVGYVGLRLLPPVAGAFEGFRGWLVEGPCAAAVFVGVRAGLRARRRPRRALT